MAGRLLLRFDDLCPTMNWPVWLEIEGVLSDAGVKPIVAVIPDNRDPAFHLTPARDDFWDHVRRWQARGWTIGLHGYQHLYVTRCGGLLGINQASEFAGLPAEEQGEKIRRALRIFRTEGIEPNVWVAPGHSFDTTTLQVLAEVGLQVVSDGFSILPYRDGGGMFWVPQQMWRIRPMPFGVWTVCFHHNFWGPGAVGRFRRQLSKCRNQISSFEEVLSRSRGRTQTRVDHLSAITLSSMLTLKRAFRRSSQVASVAKTGLAPSPKAAA